MAVRRDGIDTQERLLTAASEVFAEKGYHDATVEDICKRADANTAAINYHFGSKDRLYAKVWRHAFDVANEAYPPEGGLGPDAPPEERLAGTIRSLVAKTVDPGRLGDVGKLLVREMVNPTDVIEQVKHDAIQPLHDRTNRLMAELLGPKASKQQILFCEMSIIHQCITVGMGIFKGKLPPHLRFDMPPDKLVEELSEHIIHFSIGGIKALRRRIENGDCNRETFEATQDIEETRSNT